MVESAIISGCRASGEEMGHSKYTPTPCGGSTISESEMVESAIISEVKQSMISIDRIYNLQ